MTKKQYTEERIRKNLRQIKLTNSEFELYNKNNLNRLIHEILKSQIRINSVDNYIKTMNNADNMEILNEK